MNKDLNKTEFPKDPILAKLVEKKAELLDQLLVCSLQTVVSQAIDQAGNGNKRQKLLSMLQQNDKIISKRELETGLSAISQEQIAFQKISRLLSAIKDNNQAAISRFEKESEEFEQERLTLQKNNKISRYVQQSNAYTKTKKV